MATRATPRKKSEGFVGLQLTPELLQKLDVKVAEHLATTGSGSRSAIIRLAIIEYLK